MTDPRRQGWQNQVAGAAMTRNVASWFARAGFRVIWMNRPGIPAGRRGHRGTMMSPGIPDLRIYDPRGLITPFWWEVKSGNARLTPAQREFKALCDAQEHEPHYVGDDARAKDLLRHLGLLVLRDGIEVLRPIALVAEGVGG